MMASQQPLPARPGSRLERMRIRHTSTEEQEVNPKPRLASETDDRDSDAFRDLMTPEALRELSGEADLADVERLELIVDTSESSLGRLGSLVPNLRELRLSGSRVSTIRDLGTTLGNVEVLWMSQCGLRDLDGISALDSVTELYVAFNAIKECSALTMLEHLEILDLEGNAVADVTQVEYLRLCPKLRQLTLAGNPVSRAATGTDAYRDDIFTRVPQLTLLDDLPLGASGNTAAADAAGGDLVTRLLQQQNMAADDSGAARPGTAAGGRPGTAASRRPGTASLRPGTARRPATAAQRPVSSAGLRPGTSTGRRGSFDMEDDDDDDGSSALTHGSKVAFQGSPLKALMARRRQRPADAKNDNEKDLEELMASVGLLDDEDEDDTGDDPFGGLTREDVTSSLKAWRERLSAPLPVRRGGAADPAARPSTSASPRSRSVQRPMTAAASSAATATSPAATPSATSSATSSAIPAATPAPASPASDSPRRRTGGRSARSGGEQGAARTLPPRPPPQASQTIGTSSSRVLPRPRQMPARPQTSTGVRVQKTPRPPPRRADSSRPFPAPPPGQPSPQRRGRRRMPSAPTTPRPTAGTGSDAAPATDPA